MPPTLPLVIPHGYVGKICRVACNAAAAAVQVAGVVTKHLKHLLQWRVAFDV
jgi:hypothetical protein